MEPTHCPPDHELLSLVTGGAVADSVRAHVNTCGGCRLRVERLRAEVKAVQKVANLLPVAAGAESTTVAPQAATATWPSATEFTDASSSSPEQISSPLRPDTIGRYRIVGELDVGGQATVYRAVHPTLPRDLVLKIAHESTSIDRSLLRGDAEILCELDHPNLVRVYDLDIHDGRPFVVMEFVRGRNLKQVADQSSLPYRQAAASAAEVARALEYAHRRGVVHQDIKPQNILLDESGRPRLIDFGMARWRHGWTESQAGPSGGTLAFMAPEQARVETERVGAPSDIFALGGVLYFLLTGQAPFGGETRSEQWRRASQCDFDRAALRAKGIPHRLERIVLKAMAADPDGRYASADEMAQALDAYLRRPRRLAVLAVVLLLATLSAVGWSLWPRPTTVSNQNGRIDAAPASNSPGRAEPVPSVTAPQPLRIELFQVALHHRAPDDPEGLIGINAFAGRLNQDARVQARFNTPAYSFLIALNPDGSNQLCYPEERDVAPSLTSTIDYPPDPRSGFSLTDGVGTQMFVLVVSGKPLPSFADWSSPQYNHLPWKPVADSGVWRYDGRSFDHDKERGDIRRLADLPQPLEATCRALQAGPGVDAIRAVAFPVRHPEKSKTR
jgi:serine/threonine protein kinase